MPNDSTPIDRRALVSRHNVVLNKPDPLTPLTVGNGDFAFTVDITGLQTFDEFHETGMPIGTQSNWGWHSFPNPENYTLEDCEVKFKDARGREVPYHGQLGSGFGGKDKVPQRAKDAMNWLRINPHRLDLGRIGLILKHADGSEAKIEELKDVKQTLDLWAGGIRSEFTFDGAPVHVTTMCHPSIDAIGVRIESALLRDGKLGIRVRFAGPCSDFRKAYDWSIPDQHQTELKREGTALLFARTVGETRYEMHFDPAQEPKVESSNHICDLRWTGSDAVEFVAGFATHLIDVERLPALAILRETVEKHWKNLWSSGGAIDLSGSTDLRAGELERRIVLSQYLTAVQCSGTVPPQETGLTCNSWFGKFHLEMHWWHAAHFPLWGRDELLSRSIPWYRMAAGWARSWTDKQGYRGVRWQKMLGPHGPETPSDIGVMLLWQQPHPIYYLELLRRNLDRDDVFMGRWCDLVFETAEWMASFAAPDAAGHFQLGPPCIPAQEADGKNFQAIKNPTYELAYWWWGLKTANAWRERLGLSRHKEWDDVADKLAPLPIKDGVYLAVDSDGVTCPASPQPYRDHPSHLMCFGWTPATPMVDRDVLSRTYDDVLKKWDWPSTWGWDYPAMAMTAAKLGRTNDAVDALLMNVQKNTYLANGHNYQDDRLPLYLPGNGGLLYAVAMMAAGWDGAPAGHAPGFPNDGSWIVRHEGLKTAP